MSEYFTSSPFYRITISKEQVMEIDIQWIMKGIMHGEAKIELLILSLGWFAEMYGFQED